MNIQSHLVSDWKKAHRWLSMQLMSLGVVFSAAWMAMPDDIKTTLPSWVPQAIGLSIFGGAIAGRVYKQKDKP